MQKRERCSYSGAFVAIEKRLSLGDMKRLGCCDPKEVRIPVKKITQRLRDRRSKQVFVANSRRTAKRRNESSCRASTSSTSTKNGSISRQVSATVPHGLRHARRCLLELLFRHVTNPRVDLRTAPIQTELPHELKIARRQVLICSINSAAVTFRPYLAARAYATRSRSGKAVVSLIKRTIFRGLCRSQLRAARREKPFPNGSKSPGPAKFCVNTPRAATCSHPRAGN